jgi:mRNA-degrading endonuclease toxin of MazEF toxin-antitoxin module
MEIRQGDVQWAELGEPAGSDPEFRRPVVVAQGNHFNRSQLRTAICVPLTSNLVWAAAPGNTLLATQASGLPMDSVANASQIISTDRSFLTERVRQLPPRFLAQKTWMVSMSYLGGDGTADCNDDGGKASPREQEKNQKSPRKSPGRDASPPFTHLQGQYLAFIHTYTKLHRIPPAEVDMQRYFRVTPPSVHRMVMTLARNGFITRVPGQARSIRVKVPPEQLPELA